MKKMVMVVVALVSIAGIIITTICLPNDRID